MKVIQTENYNQMSQRAAALIMAQVIEKPDSVLGFATGTTPIGTYECLARWHRQGILDFFEVRTVNLDEYCGLNGTHPQSYRYFMEKNLFKNINIRPENTFLPNGESGDCLAECSAYEKKIISLGGIDLQLLGIGNNGHIGFNEPDSIFPKETHQVALTQSTIDANARLFEKREEVPLYAVTMGIQTIMNARRIVLIANGEGKRDILKKAVFGPIDPMVPASILQLHQNVTIITDTTILDI
jgi:glucosamine-6-phosphate deaminase